MKTETTSRRVVFWWLFSIFWVLFTVYLSSQNGVLSTDLSDSVAWPAFKFFRRIIPTLSYERFSFAVRKMAHFGAHAVLAFVLYRAAIGSYPQHRLLAMVFTLSIALPMAIVDEVIQLQVPGRFSAVSDAVINLSGVLVGVSVSRLIS